MDAADGSAVNLVVFTFRARKKSHVSVSSLPALTRGGKVNGRHLQRSLEDREISDSEFVAKVRRHRPSALLPLIAATAAANIEPDGRIDWQRQRFVTPWGLAEIARTSLAYSNEHRGDATEVSVVECLNAYNNLGDPELAQNVLGIYYAGFAHWGKAFADDLGDIFESYVGRQLNLLEEATVQRAITYARTTVHPSTTSSPFRR